MATVKLVLTKPVNTSLQAKSLSSASNTSNMDTGAWDVIYFTRIVNGKQSGDIYRLGKCTGVQTDAGTYSNGADSITVSSSQYLVEVEADETAQTPDASDFIFFGKENMVNTGGVKGYFAEVEMKTDSSSGSKLFSVGSEVTMSSK